ncbi:hypothetical protein RDWZM_000884 [Blomia tropicalis]|uniref:Uncharacterized protein n=1 Tax=Blomia tropicalis TaxID=40697 RepID=A0A9Q0RQ13_BLOTA|nr:hypothetical protein RDWZM_000884 [Blomia tropicalis]
MKRLMERLDYVHQDDDPFGNASMAVNVENVDRSYQMALMVVSDVADGMEIALQAFDAFDMDRFHPSALTMDPFDY